MNRRTYLAAGAAVAASLAGCLGDRGGRGGEPALDISGDELVAEGGEVYLAVTVENTGAGPSGWITLDVDWYAADGEFLANDLGHLWTLGPDEQWDARVYFSGASADLVEEYGVEGMADPEVRTVIDGLEPREVEMQAVEDRVVVTGRIANEIGEDQPSVDVISILYDDRGVVLGDAWAAVSDLAAEENRPFETSWPGRDRAGSAVDQRTFVSESAF
ncbi:MAG: FxLYD domain-containing protein [Halalkalicoccus sp.]|nr:FxLYD domain-containing protein [Halalkalicoccus sp.]